MVRTAAEKEAYLLHISPVDDFSNSAAAQNAPPHLPCPSFSSLTSSCTLPVLVSPAVSCVSTSAPIPDHEKPPSYYEALDILEQAKNPNGVMVHRDNQSLVPILSVSLKDSEWIRVAQTYLIRITSRFPSWVRSTNFDLSFDLLDHFKLHKPTRAYPDPLTLEWMVEFTDRVSRNTAIKWHNHEAFDIIDPVRWHIEQLQLVSEQSRLVLPKRDHIRREWCVDLASELTGMLLTAASAQVRRNYIDVALATAIDRWLKLEGEKRVAVENEKRLAREKENILRIAPIVLNLAAITVVRPTVVTKPWQDQDDDADGPHLISSDDSSSEVCIQFFLSWYFLLFILFICMVCIQIHSNDGFDERV